MEFLQQLQEMLLAAAGEARRKKWQAFLAQREPEKREKNPNVANYEKRPEAITFQHPLSVKGTMERTQVAPDLRLELFAAEPDGRADKFTVFAEKLNMPTSLVLVRGGVIVSQPPRFLFLKDNDGDDRADVREVILQGWGISDTHSQAKQPALWL